MQNINLGPWPGYFNSSEAVPGSQVPAPSPRSRLHTLASFVWTLGHALPVPERFSQRGIRPFLGKPCPQHPSCSTFSQHLRLFPRGPHQSVIPQSCVRLASPSTELRQGRTCVLLSKVALLFITGQESSGRGLEPGSPRALASPIQQLSVLNFHDSRICQFSPLVTSSQAQPQILPS